MPLRHFVALRVSVEKYYCAEVFSLSFLQRLGASCVRQLFSGCVKHIMLSVFLLGSMRVPCATEESVEGVVAFAAVSVQVVQFVRLAMVGR